MAVDKERLLKHLHTEVYCRLGISTVHGIGVFAIRTIPKGATPFTSLVRCKEIDFSIKEVESFPASVRKEIEAFCFYNSKKYQIPTMGLNTMNLAFYMNHSKKPNVRYMNNGEIVTLREIQANEELFFDYDKAFGENHNFD